MTRIAFSMLLALAAPTLLWAQNPDRQRPEGRGPRGAAIVAATYNLRMNTPADGENAWPNRAARVRELVRFHEWDIFGTQEGYRSQLDDLAQMEEYAWIGVGRDDGADKGEHSAIFYRRRRFELLDKGDFWLSQTPDRPSLGWDAPSNIRICSWGRFRDRLSGREFCLFCAHYDHIGRQARTESSRLVLARIAEIAKGAPTIFMGDLNSAPDTEAAAILDGAMRDARKVSQTPPYGPVGTFNGFDWERGTGEGRIDYIFCTEGVRVLKYGVLTDSADRRYPSDHFPVMVKMVFE